MDINSVSGHVVDAAIQVHRAVGPGLLESAYRECLTHELRMRGLHVLTEVSMPLNYKGVVLKRAYRIDMLVEDVVIVELKVVSRIKEVHRAQLLSQLRMSNRKVGLLINFNVARLKDGIIRLVNNL